MIPGEAKFLAEHLMRIIRLEVQLELALDKISRQETCINNLQEAIVIIERELSHRWGE